MKWVALLLFAGLVPVLISWLRSNPGRAPMLWTVMGFLPFVMDPWHLIVAPISWAMWPGFAKGLELSLLDFVALAVFLRYQKIRIRSPLLTVLPFYIFVVLATMAWSGVPMAAFFYAWQLARVLLLFTAVAMICQDERGPSALITGMVLGLCVQAGYAVEQRLAGVTQASGTFGHQNLLGMVSHFVTFPALAVLMIDGKKRAPLFGVLAGAVVIIFGASRATLGLAGAGFVALLLLSIIRRPTARKSMIVGLGLVGLAVATPLALSSLKDRFTAAPISADYDERAAFERAARMVIADHPMGIGANQYVVVANTQGYSDRAGVIWNFGSRGANVHNAYLLVWAETGFLGLAAFVLMLLAPARTALRTAWRNRKDPRGDLLLGLGVCLTVVTVHCFFEWIFVVYPVEVLFAIDTGIITGLARQMSLEKSLAARRQKQSDNDPSFAGASEAA